MGIIAKGTWVEIEQVVLQPADRSTALPEDTKKVPYILRVSGFLLRDAQIGDKVEVKTIIGRILNGELKTVNPSYAHSFGTVVPELLTIGTEYEA